MPTSPIQGTPASRRVIIRCENPYASISSGDGLGTQSGGNSQPRSPASAMRGHKNHETVWLGCTPRGAVSRGMCVLSAPNRPIREYLLV